jgi:hypothetical protein
MHISYVHPLAHVEGMLIAYLPREKIVIEADLYDPPPAGQPTPRPPSPASQSFYQHVQRLGLEVETIAPIHGPAVPWSEFLKHLGRP